MRLLDWTMEIPILLTGIGGLVASFGAWWMVGWFPLMLSVASGIAAVTGTAGIVIGVAVDRRDRARPKMPPLPPRRRANDSR